MLRGTGSTLTSYVYYNSPAGEGNAHEKAYAAAFVLLIIVLVLNSIVTRLTDGGERGNVAGASHGCSAPGRRGAEMDPLMPPPIRRIALDREPTVAPRRATPAANGNRQRAQRPRRCAPPRPPVGEVRERMRLEGVWLAYGENWVVRDVSLPVRQGEVLALIGASGSGKTTLLRSLNRLTEITAGAARAGRITPRRHRHPRARGQRPAPAASRWSSSSPTLSR